MEIVKCEFCGKEYSNKKSLRAHKVIKHGVKTKPHRTTECPICNIKCVGNILARHLREVHSLKNDDKMFLIYTNACSNRYFSRIPTPIKLEYITHIYDLNGLTNAYSRQFETFYDNICKIRDFKDSDIENFIKNVLPWKLSHPKQGNSKELCCVMFPSEPELAERFYDEFMKAKNPFVGHGSELSPFSKDFVGYKELNNTDKEKRMKEALKCGKVGRSWTQIEYWTKKGYSEEEARNIISKKQSTFSKKICIEKYGETLGLEIFRRRQERWQETLNNKPLEERLRILKDKVEKSRHSGGFSKREHEFSSQLVSEECMNITVSPSIIVDIAYYNKVIEFYGSYYHCDPSVYDPDFFNFSVGMTAKERWERDATRIEAIRELGYDVKIVWEREYLANTEKVISECRDFLQTDVDFSRPIVKRPKHKFRHRQSNLNK